MFLKKFGILFFFSSFVSVEAQAETITFNGSLSNYTCSISINDGASTVVIPDISTSEFTAVSLFRPALSGSGVMNLPSMLTSRSQILKVEATGCQPAQVVKATITGDFSMGGGLAIVGGADGYGILFLDHRGLVGVVSENKVALFDKPVDSDGKISSSTGFRIVRLQEGPAPDGESVNLSEVLTFNLEYL